MGVLDDFWGEIKKGANDVWDNRNWLFPGEYLLEVGAKAAWKWFKHAVIPDMRRDREAMVNTATDARRIVYGRTRSGGSLVYAVSAGEKEEYLYMVVVFTGHIITGFDEIWFNDQLAATVTNGTLTVLSPFAGYADITICDGTQTTALSNLIANSHGEWTTAHVLRGCSYVCAKLTYNESVYAAGMPSLKSVIRGKQVYDPRTGETLYTSNPALCIRDYMLLATEHGGMGCDSSEINDDTIIAAANICDQNVLTPDGIEHRYTINGVVVLDGTSNQILSSMLGAMAGQALYSGWEWAIFAGAYTAPVATIDESWLNGGIKLQTGNNKNDRINTAKGTYTNPHDLWADDAFPSVPTGTGTPPNVSYWTATIPAAYNSASTYTTGQYVSVNGKAYCAVVSVPMNTPPPEAGHWALIAEYSAGSGYEAGNIVQRGSVVYTALTTVPVANAYIGSDREELASELSFPYTTSMYTAQRLAKIVVEKSRRGLSVEYPCNMKAAVFNAMDTIQVNVNLLGWQNKLFKILSWDFSAMGGVNLSLIEEDENIWLDPSDYGTLAPSIMSNLPSPWVVSSPTGLTTVETLYATVAPGIYKSQLILSWSSGGASGTMYDVSVDENVIATIANTTYIIYDLAPARYKISVRARNGLGAVSAWISQNKTIYGKNIPPSDVTGQMAVQKDNRVVITWDPVADVDLAGYSVRCSNNAFCLWDNATVIHDSIVANSTDYQPSSSGVLYYFIRAIDTSGNLSANIAVANCTYTAINVNNADVIVGTSQIIDDAVSSHVSQPIADTTSSTAFFVWGILDMVVTADTVGKPHQIILYAGSSQPGTPFLISINNIADSARVALYSTVAGSTADPDGAYCCALTSVYTPPEVGTQKIRVVAVLGASTHLSKGNISTHVSKK